MYVSSYQTPVKGKGDLILRCDNTYPEETGDGQTSLLMDFEDNSSWRGMYGYKWFYDEEPYEVSIVGHIFSHTSGKRTDFLFDESWNSGASVKCGLTGASAHEACNVISMIPEFGVWHEVVVDCRDAGKCIIYQDGRVIHNHDDDSPTGMGSIKLLNHGVSGDMVVWYDEIWVSNGPRPLREEPKTVSAQITFNQDPATASYDWYAQSIYTSYDLTDIPPVPPNSPPNVTSVFIIPSVANGDGFDPITTTDMDCKFTPEDPEEDDVNVSITWYKNSSSVVSNVGTYNYTFVNPTRNVSKQTTSGQGRTTEALSKDDIWWCSLDITDGTSTVTQISNKITVVNNPPSIDTVVVVNEDLSTNNNGNKANKGETIDFEVTGNDAEEDDVQLRICETNSTWAGCTVICEQTTPVGFEEIVDNTIECSLDTSSITTTNSTFWVVLRDSPSNDEITSGPYSYYTNQPIVYSDISHKDTSGDTEYFFGEYLDYVAVVLDDPEDDDDSMAPYYTIYDPEDAVIVNNVLMNHQISTTYWNQNDVFLDAVGEWTAKVCTTDSDGWQICYNETFNVSIVSKSFDTTIYGWNYNNISLNSSVDDDMTNYAYNYIEFEIDNTASAQDWSDVKERINRATIFRQQILPRRCFSRPITCSPLD